MCFYLGAALGPLMTGLISPTGWTNVFYMLILSDVFAMLVSGYIVFSNSGEGSTKKLSLSVWRVAQILSYILGLIILVTLVVFVGERFVIFEQD